MRVTFSNTFDQSSRSITQAASALAEAERQVSSGRRIDRPSDDPLATASSIGVRATVTRIDAYVSASDTATSRLSVADSVLTDVINQLTAAQTSALGARGTVQTQAQRTAAAGELLAIRDALMSDINTQFQGTYLFSGSQVTTAPYVAVGAGVSAYQGDQSPTSVDVGRWRTASSTFDGGQIYQGSDPQHVLDVLTNLAAAVTAGDNVAIGVGIDALNRAFDRATAAQAQIGNQLHALEGSRIQLTSNRNSAMARVSKLEDADLAQASMRLTQAETAYRAALGAAATLDRVSLMDYLK